MIAAAVLSLGSDDPLSSGLPILALFPLSVLALLTCRNVADGPLLARILSGVDLMAVSTVLLLLLFGGDLDGVAVALTFVALPSHGFASFLRGSVLPQQG